MILTLKHINFWGANKSSEIQTYIDYIKLGLEKLGFHIVIDNNSHNPDIVVSSVFGDPSSLSKFDTSKTFIIVLTGENTELPVWKKWSYSNIVSKYNIGAYIGFDRIEGVNRFRVPVWFFRHELFKKNDIELTNYLKQPELVTFKCREKQIALINSHGRNQRNMFYDKCVSKNIQVLCGGKFKHNDKRLRELDRENNTVDAKLKYLSEFLFNVCCENSNTNGYCTEKLFECAIAGCIPIYWGDYENEDIFNQDRILKCKSVNEKSINEIIDKVLHMLHDKEYLKSFFNQPIFKNEAVDIIKVFINKSDLIADLFLNFKNRV